MGRGGGGGGGNSPWGGQDLPLFSGTTVSVVRALKSMSVPRQGGDGLWRRRPALRGSLLPNVLRGKKKTRDVWVNRSPPLLNER